MHRRMPCSVIEISLTIMMTPYDPQITQTSKSLTKFSLENKILATQMHFWVHLCNSKLLLIFRLTRGTLMLWTKY